MIICEFKFSTLEPLFFPLQPRQLRRSRRTTTATMDNLKHMDEKFDNLSDFGGESSLPPPPILTAEEENKLWGRIDRRITPVLSLMYAASPPDRGNMGGPMNGLDLSGNRYNVALTMFFITYCLFAFPANLFLKPFRPSRWLPAITFTWGLVSVLMGQVKNYQQLVGARICFGFSVAGLFPGLIFYLSIWYPRHRLQWPIALFVGSGAMAGAFGDLVTYAIGLLGGQRHLQDWGWNFTIKGSYMACCGLAAFFFLVDSPATASFLTPEERAFIIFKKKYDNSSVGEEEHFEMRHLWAALADWQVWLHSLIFMSVTAPLYGVPLILPPIIDGFGQPAAIRQLLTVPPFVFAAICLHITGYYSDKLKMRSPFVLLSLMLCLIGFVINISDVRSGVKYFGTFFCVAGCYSAMPGVLAWLGNNLSGQYKRGIGLAIQVGMGNFAGAIVANVYGLHGSLELRLGNGIELMFVGIGFIASFIAIISYTHINRKRDQIQTEELGKHVKITHQQLKEMGDRAPDFRYTL